ncbi:hypothetical protein D9M68_720790 [compost metagenome]
MPLASPMMSLKAVGRMLRMACGSTMREAWRRRERPSAAAASSCPWSTDKMPPRTISEAKAAWFSVRPSSAATKGLMSCVVGYEKNVRSVNGTPSDTVSYR